MTGSAELTGCRILVTAQRRAGDLGAALERRGAVVEHAPVLSVVPHVDDVALVARTRDLVHDPPDVLVVTTGVGFTGWVESADAAGLAPDLIGALSGARILARGPKARGSLHTHGLVADWVATSETSAEIRDHLLAGDVRGLRVAVQHHGAGADGLDEALAAAGADVCSLVVYRWGPPPDPAAVQASVRSVAAARQDAVVFTSAPGAAAFLAAAEVAGVKDDVVEAFSGPVLAAAVGPVTAGPLRAAGIAPLVPGRARLGALVRSIVEVLGPDGGEVTPTAGGQLRVLRGGVVLDGQPLPLAPSSLAVLRLLVAAKGAVVDRSAILEALPGGSRDTHAVDVAVARLRESLGRPGLVRTVVRRGYRLDSA